MNESSRWNLRFGFLDETVRSFAAKHRELFRVRSALITCVDSCPAPGRSDAWIKLLAENAVKFELLADCVWIPPSHLLGVIDARGILAGFDEMYLIAGKPESAMGIAKRFTSDWANFSKELPDEVVQQMQRVGADGYFSDGCGLNFVLSHNLAEIALEKV